MKSHITTLLVLSLVAFAGCAQQPKSPPPAADSLNAPGNVEANVSRTYTVKPGDAGFWGIAEKVYGEGRYWQLIARANPNTDSNALRVGQKLSIPPLRKAPVAGK